MEELGDYRARDREVWEARKGGAKHAELTARFKINSESIRRICRNMKWIEAHPDVAAALTNTEINMISFLESRGFGVTMPADLMTRY